MSLSERFEYRVRITSLPHQTAYKTVKKWCVDNCEGEWAVGSGGIQLPNGNKRFRAFFDDQRDAALFKLFFG